MWSALQSEELFVTCLFADVYYHVEIESYDIECVTALLPLQHPPGTYDRDTFPTVESSLSPTHGLRCRQVANRSERICRVTVEMFVTQVDRSFPNLSHLLCISSA
jgi:hypothetical protein